jgi:hypothetical protein
MDARVIATIAGTAVAAAGLGLWIARRSSASSSSSSESVADSGTTTGQDILTEVDVTAQRIGITNAPRGIRNNNPGNLEYLPAGRAWNGQVGSDGRYGVYDTPANGVRALSKQLQKDFARGDSTLEALITEWAPPKENDTASYIAAVSMQTGLGATDRLDLMANLMPLVAAIIQHENGEQPYSIDDLQQWVHLA